MRKIYLGKKSIPVRAFDPPFESFETLNIFFKSYNFHCRFILRINFPTFCATNKTAKKNENEKIKGKPYARLHNLLRSNVACCLLHSLAIIFIVDEAPADENSLSFFLEPLYPSVGRYELKYLEIYDDLFACKTFPSDDDEMKMKSKTKKILLRAKVKVSEDGGNGGKK